MAVLTATGVPVYRLTAGAYQRIVDTGALDGERVELLEGIMSEMSPQSGEHAEIVEVIAEYVATAGRVRTHSPFEIEGADSVPAPDVVLTAEARGHGRHPRTASVVVEVAVSSQIVDRQTKAPLYARAAVPVYWLVDVPAGVVEVRTQPADGDYRELATYRADETLPAPVPDLRDLPVAALLTLSE